MTDTTVVCVVCAALVLARDIDRYMGWHRQSGPGGPRRGGVPAPIRPPRRGPTLSAAVEREQA